MKDLHQYFDSLEKETRDKAAIKYRLLLLENELSDERIDYASINQKIIARWSISALEYIKEKAWVQKTPTGRTWCTALDMKSRDWGVYHVSKATCIQFMRVGFSSYEEATQHLEKLKIAKPRKIAA